MVRVMTIEDFRNEKKLIQNDDRYSLGHSPYEDNTNA